MSVEEIAWDYDAGAGSSLRFGEPSTGKVFDFSLNSFVTLTGGTNEKLLMTEVSANNKGTGLSTYFTSLDVSRINRSGVPKRISVDAYAGVLPLAAAQPWASLDQVVQFGRFGEAPVNLPCQLTPRTPDGYNVQMAVGCEHGAVPVNLFGGGKMAFTVTAGSDLINCTAHGLSALDAVCFITYGVLPGGLAAGQAYYVRNQTLNSFQVSLTPTGAIIDITTAGTGLHYWDNPTCMVSLRELGASSAAFIKSMTAADIRGHRFEGEYPVGAAFTANAGTDVITSAGHGRSNGDLLVFTSDAGGALPGGMVEALPYYVINQTTDTFKVSETAGGTAVDLTSAGSGTLRWNLATSIFRPGRQYEVSVSMTYAGQTHTDTHNVYASYAPAVNITPRAVRVEMDANSTKLTTIQSGVSGLGSPMQAGTKVVLNATQTDYVPAIAGAAMTLTAGERTAIATAMDANSVKLGAIHGKLPSRAKLTGTAAATGALDPTDLPFPGQEYWGTQTPQLLLPSLPGATILIEFLSDDRSQVYAHSGSPSGWFSATDPSYATRYAAGDLTLEGTTTSGGLLAPISIPTVLRANGVRIQMRSQTGGSPSPTDPLLNTGFRLVAPVSTTVTDITDATLKKFATVNIAETPISGSVIQLSQAASQENLFLLLDTTVQSVVDNQTFILVGGGSTLDSSFENALVILRDVSASNAPVMGQVSTWNHSTKQLKLRHAAGFTVASGDRVTILVSPIGPYSPTGPYVLK